jgi:hypothetical protein
MCENQESSDRSAAALLVTSANSSLRIFMLTWLLALRILHGVVVWGGKGEANAIYSWHEAEASSFFG